METITIKFPEVKLEIPIKGLNFTELEKMVFEIVMQIGRKTIEMFLTALDEAVRKRRPRGVLTNRGKVFKHILTRLGDIAYNRVKYEDKATGEVRYLTDEVLGLEKDQRISLSRQKLELHAVSEASYRKSRDNIKRLTGSSRSYEAMRQSVIKEANKIIGYQKKSFEKTEALEYEIEGKGPEIAYSESDATGIRLQTKKKGKKRKKKTLEVKLGIGYTGRETRYEGGKGKGKRLVSKFVYVSIEGRRKFMKELSLIAERKLGLSKAKKIFFGGDGAAWIKTGIKDFFGGAVYVLCRFHLWRNLREGLVKNKAEQKEIKKLLKENNTEKALEIIRGLHNEAEDEKDRKAVGELYTYIANNRDGIKAGNELEKGVERTGAIEANIDKVIAHRMKKRGMSWSRNGAISLLKIKELVINGDWDNWWTEEREQKITIDKKWEKPLGAKYFKKSGRQVPWIETAIPALGGREQDKPWAGILRKLVKSRYEVY